MAEVSKRWYLGTEERRENVIQAAKLFAGGNVSKLVNQALIAHYKLDPETMRPRESSR